MSSNGEYFATFMTFAALVLEIFVLLSGTANQPVLRDLYFARVAYQGRFTTMGLWGSCYGSNGVYSECSVPSVYNWPEAEGLNFQLSPDLPSSIYIAIFALYWVSFAASAFAMQVTTFTYFRKFPDLFLAFVSWMATGALFIIFIIVVVAAAKFKEAAEAVSGASGEIGNSTWMVLGAMIASFIASVWYSWNYLNRRGKSALDTFKY